MSGKSCINFPISGRTWSPRPRRICSPDTAVAFRPDARRHADPGRGPGVSAGAAQPSLPQPSSPQLAASDSPAASAAVPGASSGANLRIAEQKSAPIRLAALDGKTDYFPGLKPRDTTFQAVRPTDNPDLIWDPASHDVIAWGDVIAYGVGLADLSSVIDRTAAIRALKSMSTQSPQVMRVSPDDRLHRDRQTVNIDLSEVQGTSGGVVQRFRRWHHPDALSEGPRCAVGPNGQSAASAACA